jgi:N-acetylneuraminic acid mutarotase
MRRSTHPQQPATTLRAALALVVAVVAAVALAVASSNAAQPEAGTYTQVSWSSAAPQPLTNSEAQGVVLGGRLFSFGGFDSQKACCTPTSRAYAFDPATDAWTALTPIPGVSGRPGGFTHAGIATDGQFIYLAGGYTANAAGTGQVFGTREVWRFDPAANAGLGSYTRIADLPSERAGGQLAVVSGNLHFFGGTNLARTADTPEHWALPLTSARTSGGTWAVKAPMANARHHMGSAVLDGKIYAIGGQDAHDEQLVTQADVDVYDPATDAWSAAPADLPPVTGATGAGRGHISSATVVQDGRIVVLGGESAHGAVTNEVVAWRPGASAWTKLTPLPAPARSGVAGVLGGRLYYTSGDSAATYRGAPVVMGGCADVSELTCAQVRANLPLRVDFTGTEGGLYDAQGQDLGFTMVQKSTTGQYRPERLDVDGGVLRLTTTSGINFRKPEAGAVNPNSLDNGLGVGVDASKPLRIETTVIQPALGSGASEQPAVWFGPDQDNYVKVDVVSANPASPTHRPQIVWEVAGVPAEITIDQPGTNFSNQDVRLILETDPVTRIATGYLQLGTGARTVIGQTTALPQSWFAAPTAPQGSGFAGIFGTHRNRTTGPLTYRFADFGVTDLTPAPDTAPNMEVATTRLVASDASALAGGTTKSVSVRNTGGGPLTLQAPTVTDDPSATGDDAGQFTAANRTTTIPAGGEGLVDVTFAPTTNGVKSAYLTIRGDDPDAPTATVKLRGLGITNFSGGSSEPSLQRILDTYEIPVTVGDDDPNTASIKATATADALLGQEVSAQTFEPAGPAT